MATPGQSCVEEKPSHGGLPPLAGRLWLIVPVLVALAALAACGGGSPAGLTPGPGGETPTAAPEADGEVGSPEDEPSTDGSVVSAPDGGDGASAPPTQEPERELPVGGDVGERAPDFTVTLADGSTASLESLLAPGKPLLLYFFATW